MKKLGHFFNVLKNFIIVKCKQKPAFDKKSLTIKWYCPVKPAVRCTDPVVTWIGQATFLIQIDGINILTDPHFFDTSIFYKRLIPPGIPIKNLPHIDVVIISHNHIDHMDKKSLLAIKHHNPLVLAPNGDGRWFWRKGFKNVIENKWGDKHIFKNVKFTYLPAAHWTGRYVFDFNRSTCGSWMVEHEKHKLYFAGDSSYDKHFCEIAQEFSTINTALLPIGPVEPRYSVEHAHLDGKQALQAFIDLNAKTFIPMHWGTFQFGSEEFEEPVKILEREWAQHGNKLVNKKLFVMKFGKGQSI